MISFGIIVAFLIVHLIGDFVLQTSQQAENKHHSDKALFSHVGTYSLTWMTYLLMGSDYVNLNILGVIFFTVVTGLSHLLIDYFTSRWSHKYFSKKDYHNGFVVVGIDQCLHYIQIFGLYALING